MLEDALGGFQAVSREKLKALPKYEPTFTVEVRDECGMVIAEVEKLLHVRRKNSSLQSQEKR